MIHTSVLLKESIDALNLSPGKVFVDATLGSAGHTMEVFRRFGDTIRYIGIDADSERLKHSREVLRKAGCTAYLVEENFRNLDRVLADAGAKETDAILFDLGLNSEQLEGSGKGFTFQKDEPLLMTFADAKSGMLTAHEIVNNYDETEIARIIYEFGEERYSRRIARAIAEARREKPIETTLELVAILKTALPKNYEKGRIHFATRTFQALRIATNDELGALAESLEKGIKALTPCGRIAVIAFHSLEDRIVKNIFRERAKEGKAVLITKKPIQATDEECRDNPRARSAKLRILEKNNNDSISLK